MVRISLRYRGPLTSGGSAHKVDVKHDIRMVLHRQLYSFCQSMPHHPTRSLWLFTQGPLVELRLKGNSIDFPDQRRLAGFVRISGYECVPLITRNSDQDVSVTIRLHRRDGPGSLISTGGDLDGRIKTLFDALRIPHSQDEVKDNPSDDSRRLFCLLEDDSLITSLSVETHQLFTPLDDEQKKHDVEADIYVELSDREYI